MARRRASRYSCGLSDDAPDFEISVPAWRARRLRAHLAALGEAGRVARMAGDDRAAPEDLAHRAEERRWLAGWDRARPDPVAPGPTPRQLAKIGRWQAGTSRLKAGEGTLRSAILDAVADEMLAVRPPPHGAIAAAHRETVRRCREAGLPAPKASRYRKWLKLTRGV
ncbi:hypothetical protein ACFOWB_01255 [Chenggangzhangella methanolivorans]|uniref:hypothetical protein n=1 Tax=Chenggangzhangella methanolivorans TaxID=1437009 RepID=UPI00361680AF